MQLSLFQFKSRPSEPACPIESSLIEKTISTYLPNGSLTEISSLLEEQPVILKIVRHRSSKSGDFRAPFRNIPARITINGNLNPYSFLITLVHEIAHYYCWLNYHHSLRKLTFRRKKRPLPHGPQWKDLFRELMSPFLVEEIFPAGILPVIKQYLKNPKASTSADHALSAALRIYDPPDQTLRLEELPFDSSFSLSGKGIFLKKEKLRTRYRCICLKTNRIYLVNPNAPVLPIINSFK